MTIQREMFHHVESMTAVSPQSLFTLPLDDIGLLWVESSPLEAFLHRSPFIQKG